MIKILLLIIIMFNNIGVYAGPLSLILCCSTVCLSTGPLYSGCVAMCISSGGIVSTPPFICTAGAMIPV